MNLMADYISSIAAIIAVIFAILEALFKFHGKKAERNILFYSKYQYICQQLDIGVYSVNSFVKKCRVFTEEQICGYAMAHVVTDDFKNIVYDFEELAYSFFKGANIEKVQKSQAFAADALSLAESVNSFYQSIIRDSGMNIKSNETINRLKIIAEKMMFSLDKLKDKNISDNYFFYNNGCLKCLIKQMIDKNKSSEKRLKIVYFAISIGLVVLCVFLLMFSMKETIYLMK